MVVIDCPYPDCEYQTQKGSEALAVVLLQMHVCADFFKNKESNHLVIVDKYSNWAQKMELKD